jgi:glucose/arabinose dehydrogenase
VKAVMKEGVMRKVLILSVLAALAFGCRAGGDADAQPSAGQSFETRPPEGTGQTPAFPGQTRAPAPATHAAYKLDVLAKGLDHPWGMQFLPDGRMLVTERVGRLRIVRGTGTDLPNPLGAPFEGVPKVVAENQGGLFDVALSPGFARDRTIFIAYFEPRSGGNGLSVARAVLNEAQGRLDDLKVIFRAEPLGDRPMNIGGRLVFARDGNLFVTVGDRFNLMDHAQKLDSDLGKVVRIRPDGSIPSDNPFVGKTGVRPEIWSDGHRTPEAAAINPSTGVLWEVEHGARGGDEINVPEAGKNYGWPVITYGIDYNGMPIKTGITQHPGMEQPLYYWDPVIAPSGMIFYTGKLFPQWRGNLLVGGLRSKRVSRLVLSGRKVVAEDWVARELGSRIRDVRQGPDGAIYLLTDETDGKIVRMSPK